jgi:hypothetical protein
MFYGQDLSENVTQLDIFNTTKQVIYSVPISQINVDQIVQITAEFEATNPYSFNVMLGSWIIMADTAISVGGTLLDPANAFNITPGNHHGVISKARNWKSTTTYANQYINLVAWAAASTASPGDNLIIEQQYGHLDVLVA